MSEQTKHDIGTEIITNEGFEYIRADLVAEQFAELLKKAIQQITAKDAVLRQALDAFLQFTSRESMDDLESFGYSADAVIEAIDKELGK